MAAVSYPIATQTTILRHPQSRISGTSTSTLLRIYAKALASSGHSANMTLPPDSPQISLVSMLRSCPLTGMYREFCSRAIWHIERTCLRRTRVIGTVSSGPGISSWRVSRVGWDGMICLDLTQCIITSVQTCLGARCSTCSLSVTLSA
jgi:hypothetical protein